MLSIIIASVVILVILWFNCTHVLSDYDLCISQQKAVATHFSCSNIGDWTEQFVLVILVNLGVYFLLNCFGRWYDFVYLFRCLFGIFMSAVVLTIEILWNGVIHTFENEHPNEFLYLYSLLFVILILLPSNLILFSLALYKRLRKPSD